MNLNKIKNFYRGKSFVSFAVLFGSHAKGKANSLSDIDIAVYLTKKIKRSSFFDVRLKLASDMPAKGKKDVIILNESSPLLAYEVIAHGRPLFIKDKKEFIDFKVLSFNRYFDTKRLRFIQLRELERRTKEGKIGHFKRNDSIKVAKVREFSRKIARAGKYQ